MGNVVTASAQLPLQLPTISFFESYHRNDAEKLRRRLIFYQDPVSFILHHVSRRPDSLRDRLQPRYPRPRPCLRVRTVCPRPLRKRCPPRTRPRPIYRCPSPRAASLGSRG